MPNLSEADVADFTGMDLPIGDDTIRLHYISYIIDATDNTVSIPLTSLLGGQETESVTTEESTC